MKSMIVENLRPEFEPVAVFWSKTIPDDAIQFKKGKFGCILYLLAGAFEAILPASILSVSSFTAPTKNVFRWAWQDGKCFAFERMKRLGVADKYVGGVIYRIECWLDCLQGPYTVNPEIDLCIMAKTGMYRGEFGFEFEK